MNKKYLFPVLLISIFLLSACAITAKDFASWSTEKRREKVLNYINTAFSHIESDLAGQLVNLQKKEVAGLRYVTVSHEEQGVVGYKCFNKKGKLKETITGTTLPSSIGDLNCQPEYGDITRSVQQPIPLSDFEKKTIKLEIKELEHSLGLLPQMQQQMTETAEKNLTFMSGEKLYEDYSPYTIEQTIKSNILLLKNNEKD